jgi:integrase
LSKNRTVAERLLRQRMAETDLAGTALADPFAEHTRTPIAAHIAAWAADLLATGRTARHVGHRRRMVTAVVKEMEAEVLADVKADAVRLAIDALRIRGDAKPELPPPTDPTQGYTPRELCGILNLHLKSLSRTARRAGVPPGSPGRPRRYSIDHAEAIRNSLPGFGLATANHYLSACKAFTRWCAGRTGRRLAVDPLSHLERWNARTDVRRRRRALTPEQFERFVSAAANGRILRGLTGPDRLVLYTLAANTGLRAAELASLTPESFSWGHEKTSATVTVAAAYSKHRREDVQPLRADVADLMRQYLAGRPPGQPVWPGLWYVDAAEIVRVDLEVAGIPFKDARGGNFDFHAIRKCFGSALGAAGVPPEVARQLMRLSSINLLTNHYSDPDLFDKAGALDKLPRLPERKPIQ